MSVAYVVVDIEITNMDEFKKYMADAPATVQAAGGEYLVRGGKLEALEGEWVPQRMTVVRFPSVEAAKAWHSGEMYRQARAKRAGATHHFNAVVVEGV